MSTADLIQRLEGLIDERPEQLSRYGRHAPVPTSLLDEVVGDLRSLSLRCEQLENAIEQHRIDVEASGCDVDLYETREHKLWAALDE